MKIQSTINMPKPILNISLDVTSDDLICQISDNMSRDDILQFMLDLDLDQQDTSFTVDLIKGLIKSLEDDSPEDIEEIKKELFE